MVYSFHMKYAPLLTCVHSQHVPFYTNLQHHIVEISVFGRLPFRFYVKSFLVIFSPSELSLWPHFSSSLWILNIWQFSWNQHFSNLFSINVYLTKNVDLTEKQWYWSINSLSLGLFSSNQLFISLFSKIVDFTEFLLEKCDQNRIIL